jgi:hypothetical protein
MSRAQRLPKHLIHLRTYHELQQYAAAFAKGHLNLLLIFGPPGVGKTRALREALHGPVCWIGGQATPLGIYLLAYQHRHQPMVLDDVDGLYADRTGIRLLKSLCQTEKTKTRFWDLLTFLLQSTSIQDAEQPGYEAVHPADMASREGRPTPHGKEDKPRPARFLLSGLEAIFRDQNL